MRNLAHNLDSWHAEPSSWGLHSGGGPAGLRGCGFRPNPHTRKPRGASPIHSLLSLPTRGEFKDLEGERLTKLQQAFSEVKYLIIDKMSMVGRKTFRQVDRRLRQAFPHHYQEVFGGCPCLSSETLASFLQSWIFPSTPMTLAQSSLTRGELPTRHSSRQWSWTKSCVRQARIQSKLGSKTSSRLRDANVTVAYYNHLMTRMQLEFLISFPSALQAVVEYNVAQLQASGQPIATQFTPS